MPKKKVAYSKDGPEIDEALAKVPESLIRKRSAYSPTERDQEVYRTWARCLSVEKTAKELKISREHVSKRLILVRSWLQDQFIDDAADVRAQHLALLQKQYAELSELWDEARLVRPNGRGRKSEATVEKLDRPIQIVKEMRETLKTIAAYIGILKPSDDSPGDDAAERVAGIPRQTFIQNQIVQLQVQLSREQEMDAERAARGIIQGGG